MRLLFYKYWTIEVLNSFWRTSHGTASWIFDWIEKVIEYTKLWKTKNIETLNSLKKSYFKLCHIWNNFHILKLVKLLKKEYNSWKLSYIVWKWGTIFAGNIFEIFGIIGWPEHGLAHISLNDQLEICPWKNIKSPGILSRKSVANPLLESRKILCFYLQVLPEYYLQHDWKVYPQ